MFLVSSVGISVQRTNIWKLQQTASKAFLCISARISNSFAILVAFLAVCFMLAILGATIKISVGSCVLSTLIGFEIQAYFHHFSFFLAVGCLYEMFPLCLIPLPESFQSELSHVFSKIVVLIRFFMVYQSFCQKHLHPTSYDRN